MEAMVFDFACNSGETDKNEETEGSRYKLTDDNGAEAEKMKKIIQGTRMK